jgi:indolepyruvate ferredoxin oxidoreductase alpha subunit
VAEHLARANRVLIIEEVDPFLEIHVKETAFESPAIPKSLKVYGKDTGHLPGVGELTPDLVLKAIAAVLGLELPAGNTVYRKKVCGAASKLLVDRGVTFCAGCVHRASFWTMKKALQKDGRGGFLTGDIGCYTLDVFPAGNHQTKALHAMGSGVGLATGFGNLSRFGSNQPVIAVCGDSTFYHAAIPALLNAIHNKSNMVMVLLDNRATAMTGFQSHPGVAFDAVGNEAPAIDAAELCRGLGCQVVVSDPFDLKGTTDKLLGLLKEDGVKVLIMRRVCELVRMREERKDPFKVWVDLEACRGQKCGYCVRVFKCPGLPWEKDTGKARIDAAVCCGCGVCVEICPYGAIIREEIA